MADSETGNRFNRANTVKALERKVIWKLETRVMPLVTLIYLANALDKFNIGNTAITGLMTDLNIYGVQLNTAISVFFIPYILVQLPSNLVMKKFGSGRWLGFLAISWGLVTTLTGLTENFPGFILVRLMLGLFEGGLAPGVLLYLSCLYKRHELQLRIGMLTSIASAADLISGLLASIIVKMDGVRNLSGWRWIFILEGIATVIIGILIAMFLPTDVGSAWFLSDEERDYATLRLEQDRSGTLETEVANSEEDETFEWTEVKRGILDIQTWLTGFAFIGVIVNLYSVQFSLPNVIVGLGYTGSQAQLHTVLPYVLAGFSIVIMSALSDRLKLRGPIVLMATSLTITGYTLVIGGNNMTQYVGCCLLVIGPYISSPCLLTLLLNNSSGYFKRATAVAVLLTFSALSGAIAPFFYTSDQQPKYIRGHFISLGFAILTWTSTAANVLYCVWENRARGEGRRSGNVEKYETLRDAGLTRAPIGDRHPNFKLTL